MNNWVKIEVSEWDWKIVLKKDWVWKVERGAIESLVENLGEETRLVKLEHSEWGKIIITLRFVNRLPEIVKYSILLHLTLLLLENKTIE